MKPSIPDTFTPIQRVCADYIESNIRMVSEEHYAQSWMVEVDYWLYAETINQKSIHLEDYILENMKVCMDTIGGWIVWDNENHEPVFMANDDVISQIEYIKEQRKNKA
jgi:hypothetical protein